MPELSYPFVYECSNCGEETRVTRGHARGLYSDPDSPNAPLVVLEQRKWTQAKGMLFCPECSRSSGSGQ